MGIRKSSTHAPAAVNTLATVTLVAVVNGTYAPKKVWFSYDRALTDGTPGTLVIKDGNTTILTLYVTDGGAGPVDLGGLPITKGNAVTAELSAYTTAKGSITLAADLE